MALSELQLELIGKYISNSLSPSEDKEFHAQLNNQVFRDELLLQGQMVDILSDSKDKELREYLNAYAQDKGKKNTSFFLEPYVKYAAVFVLLIAAFFLFKQFSGGTNIDTLALVEKYDTRYPAEIVQRGAASEMTQEYKSAMSVYANQNYKEAYNAFNNLTTQSPKIELYKANCLLAQKEYTKAITLLNQIKGNETIEIGIAENRDWYLAIAHLGNKDTEKSRELLVNISQNKNHIFNKKAADLLKVINE